MVEHMDNSRVFLMTRGVAAEFSGVDALFAVPRRCEGSLRTWDA
jgi:hypothetical protein